MGREPGAGVMPELEGAGGGDGELVQRAERGKRGKHALGVCGDGAGAQGGADEGAGGAGGSGGGDVERTGRSKHAVRICDKWAGSRGGGDGGAGGAGRGGGGHAHRAGGGKHAVGVCDDGAGARVEADEGAGGVGTFNYVANTPWAYVTMGREPGARLMRELEGWAAVQRLVMLDTDALVNSAQLSKVHQSSVGCSVEPRLRMINDMRALKETCREAFVCAKSAPSATQQQVSETLRHVAVGGGRGTLPRVRILHRHDRGARQRPGDGRREEQQHKPVGSGS